MTLSLSQTRHHINVYFLFVIQRISISLIPLIYLLKHYIYTVQSLYSAMFGSRGMDRVNHLVKGQFYKGIIGKMVLIVITLLENDNFMIMIVITLLENDNFMIMIVITLLENDHFMFMIVITLLVNDHFMVMIVITLLENDHFMDMIIITSLDYFTPFIDQLLCEIIISDKLINPEEV